jgi:hypothetical protein
MKLRRAAVLLLGVAAALGAACGGHDGLPPQSPPRVKGPDGKEYYLLDRGPAKAFYDPAGRLQRLEYDSNGDGRSDILAHHRGAKLPSLLEVDADYDGDVDRWEDYDTAGRLLKVGTSRRGRGPDVWTYPGANDQPARRDYDDDLDGSIERVESFRAGHVVHVELDGDRDGRFDRWQTWESGRLSAEELDTNADGRADRRVGYGANGKILGVERLP